MFTESRMAEGLAKISLLLIVIFLVQTYLFTLVRVEGSSMKDTLNSGERILVTVPEISLFGPGFQDIVICRYPGSGSLYVKRVIGLPGDTLAIARGKLYRNGEWVKENYVFRPDLRDLLFIRVPKDAYFVLGDNRTDSTDSRTVGFIEKNQLVGRVRGVLWPPENIREVS